MPKSIAIDIKYLLKLVTFATVAMENTNLSLAKNQARNYSATKTKFTTIN